MAVNTLKWAKYYTEKLGWSVIPIRTGDKKPAIAWEEYQQRLATPTELESWFSNGKNNIAVVTGGQSGVVVVDIDTADGEEAIKPYLGGMTTTVSAKTPRGKHVYFLHPGNTVLSNHARRLEGCDFRGDGGYVLAPPSQVSGKPYRWIRRPDKTAVGELPLAYLTGVLQQYSSTAVTHSLTKERERTYKGGCDATKPPHPLVRENMFEEGTRDDDLFHTAYKLCQARMPTAEVRQVLRSVIKSWDETQPEQRTEAWVEDKIRSALKRVENHHDNLSEEIRDWISVTSGPFSVTDCDRELEIVTKRHKATRRMVMSRLVEKGVIRRGKKNGYFQRIEIEMEEIDLLKSPDIGFLPLVFPLSLENYVGLFPGTICVVNGVKDAGKTGFLMRFVEMNMARWPKRIHYFNSEMGDVEFHNRLSKFDRPKSDWTFRAYHRNINFSEVIRPDDINVIDFLEIHKDFYEISALMWEIHDQLGSGVAIVALQKNPGSDLGLGGYRSIEKARLVINLDPGELTIHTAKGWANPDVSPRGVVIKFKLVNGCTFIADTPGKTKDTDADPETYLMGKDKYGPTFTRR